MVHDPWSIKCSLNNHELYMLWIMEHGSWTIRKPKSAMTERAQPAAMQARTFATRIREASDWPKIEAR